MKPTNETNISTNIMMNQKELSNGILVKFVPKRPTMNDSGMNMVATTVSCFITRFSRFDTLDRCRSSADDRMSR